MEEIQKEEYTLDESMEKNKVRIRKRKKRLNLAVYFIIVLIKRKL